MWQTCFLPGRPVIALSYCTLGKRPLPPPPKKNKPNLKRSFIVTKLLQTQKGTYNRKMVIQSGASSLIPFLGSARHGGRFRWEASLLGHRPRVCKCLECHTGTGITKKQERCFQLFRSSDTVSPEAGACFTKGA